MAAPKSLKKKRILAIVVAALIVAGGFALAYFYGGRLVQLVSDPQRVRQWVGEHVVAGRLAMFGLVALKTIVPVLPGEPFEIAAGYAFGAVEGTLLCALGSLAGSLLVFVFVRKVGVRAVELFYPKEKLESLRFLQNKQRLFVVLFLIFLIPGTPKDLLGFVAGLTPMKIGSWILISGVARLPSIIVSTVGGAAIGTKKYAFAAVVFAISLALSGIGFLLYRLYVKKHNEEPK